MAPDLDFATELDLVPGRTYKKEEVFGMLKRLVNITGSTLGTSTGNKLFENGTVARCLGQFQDENTFNLRIDDRGREGEFNLPEHIIDLGSMIGVVISCLVQGSDFARVLSKLDFYARFLRCFTYESTGKTKPKTNFAIGTICGVFDGKDKPFWFGSSLVSGSEEIEKINKTKDMYTRQGILAEALRKRKIVLPLMPPTHQRTLGTHIKALIYDKQVVDDEKVAKLIVELLQSITQPRNPPDHRPWEIVSIKPPNFETKVAEIVAAAGHAPDKELEFEQIKEFVDQHANWKQQYGHCAETYPLLAILGSLSTAPTASTPLDFQGLARSVTGPVPVPVSSIPVCATFYAGETMKCEGSGKCMMRCRGRIEGGGKVGLKCTGACQRPATKTKKGIQNMCERGEECTTVCQQSAKCHTRCSGEGGCTKTGPFAPCKGRKTRCEVCQDGKKPNDACKKSSEAKCWRLVCQRCMDSPPYCASCSLDGTCLKCDDFMAPCENCQALLVSTDALGFGNWNRSLKQEVAVNHYMIWDGWNNSKIAPPVAGSSSPQ